MGCAGSTYPTTFLDIKDGQHDKPDDGVQIVKLFYFADAWGRKSALEFMLDRAGIPFEVYRFSPFEYIT